MGRGRLLLVEDDERLGPLVRDVLALEWDVTLATTLAAAGREIAGSIHDVMVVDRRLPDGDGTQLVAELRARGDATPVLLLTALSEVGDRVVGLDAGANDYLGKPFDLAELSARLRALTRTWSPQGRGIGSWTFHPDAATILSPYTGRILLTEKEAALLAVLAASPNTAFTRRRLLTAVFDRGEQEGTVHTYVHYLRRKTERDLVETVRGVGYRLGTPA